LFGAATFRFGRIQNGSDPSSGLATAAAAGAGAAGAGAGAAGAGAGFAFASEPGRWGARGRFARSELGVSERLTPADAERGWNPWVRLEFPETQTLRDSCFADS